MFRKPTLEALAAALGVVALFAGVAYFRDTYPFPGRRGELDRDAIAERSQMLLDAVGVAVNNLEQTISLETDNRLLAYAQMTFGTAGANRLFAADMPAYYWRVRYRRAFSLRDLFTSSKEDKRIEIDEKPQRHAFGETSIHFDLRGRVLHFRTGVDSTAVPANNDSATVMLQLDTLRRMSPFHDEDALEAPRTEELGNPRFHDVRFTWVARIATAGVRPMIEARVRNAKLIAWEAKYEPLQKPALATTSVRSLLAPLSYAAVLLCMTAFFFRKLRADQISLRAGLPTGVVGALAMTISFLLSTTESLVERLLPAVLMALAVVVGFMLVYSVGESAMRDRGADRLRSFTALQRRHFFFRPVGDSLVAGVMLGALGFGIATVILYQLGPASQYYVEPDNAASRYYLSHIPALSLLGMAFANVAFGEVTFRLFAISLLQRYFRSLWLVALLSAILAAMAKKHLLWLEPMGLMLAINFSISILLSFAYLRFDFLTAVTAALSAQLFYLGMSLFYFPGVHSATQASLLLALPLLLLAGGAAVRRYGSDQVDVRTLEPDYVQRLAERERMARELEIARQIQQSFLPRTIPTIEGLDIASLCVPAQEAGGDYYDFIRFNPARLGVILGDVSGKGISAAFYMTLTKGIVKSLVREGLPPREVLIRANQLFYENAERGFFVSLVFGVFDLEKRLFTCARAGHNPVIIATSNAREAQMISPPGIALGLEPGEVFARSIAEKTVRLSAGDSFVFYTDGFTEARNLGMDEFGEYRLAQLVREVCREPSAVIAERLRGQVSAFAGQAPQHDDMTMVVVKVH